MACTEQAADQKGSERIHFTGSCDGSAAIRIGGDKLLVAYDEKNSLFLYNHRGGAPITEFSYGDLLGISDKEVDIEGAALVSDGVWWIGSHGLNGKGEAASNRRLLFKTKLPTDSDQQLQLLGSAIDLFPAITGSSMSEAFFNKKILRKKPKKGGLSIEGLVAESDHSLLVGLRSPLTKEKNALVVRLEKEADKFVLKKIYQLDLGKRGVRDIQKSGDGFLLIAGEVDSGGVSALYHWRPDSKARILTHLDRTLNPEALVKLDDYWLVMSDDGKVNRQGQDTCDDIASEHSANNQVYFRATKITDNSLAGK